MENNFVVCDTWGMSEETLGHFIRRHRSRSRMTQQELADAIQMTNRSVSEWETGRTVPGRDAITKLASIFKISLDEFRRYISLGDSTEVMSADQVERKEQAIQLIDELLADPQKLDEWLRYGEYLRVQDRRESQ
jgi:transcriptional regulator with XRE-family HTH domain